jgi:hypothetical protein
MSESLQEAPGRIFMSYRREDTSYAAGWLFDRLAEQFGSDQVFKDVDSIELGDDFVEKISTAVGSCDVLLALIGEEWLTITDEHGTRRLDHADDFVRLEIEAALVRKVRVIPILVEGARMPRADQLPPSLAKLVRRQALELSPSHFDFDTERLLEVLNKTLAESRKAQDVASMKAPALEAPGTSHTAPRREPVQPDRRPGDHRARETTERPPPSAGATAHAKAPFPARRIGIPTAVAFVIGLLLQGSSEEAAGFFYILMLVGLVWTLVQVARIQLHKRRRK